MTISALIQFGAVFEDDRRAVQALYHFFNPVDGQGLTVDGWMPGAPSPDWALEDVQDFGTEQPFSYKKARQYFYDALTKLDKADRDKNWGLTFQTLGQVIHHLQDMAQPQHVRNDPHCGELICTPGYFAGLYSPSRYEKWTEANPPAIALFVTYAPVYSTDDTGNFTKPRQFWTTTEGPGTGGRGIAEYTNRGFFSTGTLYSSPAFPSPTFSSLVRGPLLDITEVCAEAEAAGRPCPSGLTGKITFFANTVEDSLRPGATGINPRAASYSLFDQDLEQHGKAPVFALNRFNFDAAHGFLIPRAVAYSAGLINYFFRGRMEISLPDEGVYAIVDHATLSGIDPAAGFRGFDRIKLKLRNATPNSEPMRGGRLVAVVKFRRNLCYHDDLENSYPPQVNAYASDCRSPREDIVVSTEQAGVTLTDTARPFEFRFAQAVPINATDLRLQVVYRGTLGAETDAVAVATHDIAEPTFLTYMNASDYIKIDDKVYTRDQVNQSEALLRRVYPTSCVVPGPPRLRADCLNPFPLAMQFSLGTGPIRIEVEDLPPQRLLRIAFLGDSDAAVAVARDGICLPLDPEAVDPLRWQETYDADAAEIQQRFPTFQPLRGVWGWHDTSCVSNGDGSDPGTDDNRETAMGPIADKTPYAVTLSGF